MKRHLSLYLVLLVSMLLSCTAGNRSWYKDNKYDQIDSVNSNDSNLIISATELAVTKWGLDLEDYPFVGNKDDSMEALDKKNLYTSRRWSYCKKDSCQSGYYFIGVRCPDNLIIKQWINKQIWQDVNDCDQGIGEFEFATNDVPVKDIADFYLDKWQQHYDSYLENKFKNSNCDEIKEPTEQNGLLIADIWQNDTYCTMCVHDWYDMLSCGCPYQTSFYTINATNGQVLDIGDIISQEDYPKVENLLEQELAKMSEEHCDSYFIENDCLGYISGMALIEDGLLLYYHPKTISVLDTTGQCNIVIPFSFLSANGIELKCRLLC